MTKKRFKKTRIYIPNGEIRFQALKSSCQLRISIRLSYLKFHLTLSPYYIQELHDVLTKYLNLETLIDNHDREKVNK